MATTDSATGYATASGHHRHAKGDGCYAICRADLIDVLRRGGVLWLGKFGPSIHDPGEPSRWVQIDGRWHWRDSHELHPRRDVVRSIIDAGLVRKSDHANEVQRECGMRSYVWADTDPADWRARGRDAGGGGERRRTDHEHDHHGDDGGRPAAPGGRGA